MAFCRESKSCLGRGFNSKLGRFASKQPKCIAYTQPILELKTGGLIKISTKGKSYKTFHGHNLLMSIS
jgi:hypothetical protein